MDCFRHWTDSPVKMVHKLVGMSAHDAHVTKLDITERGCASKQKEG